VELEKEDIEAINRLDQGKRLVTGPPGKPGYVWGWSLEQLGWN